MQDRITRARLAGDPPDLLISPRVGQIGWFDFHRASDLIAYGARTAERAIELHSGSHSHSYAQLMRRRGTPIGPVPIGYQPPGDGMTFAGQAVLM